MARRKWIDKKNASHFTLVHRPQNDPLIHDESAPSMVLNPTQLGNASKVKKLGDLASELGSEAEEIRENEGEAANYGVYFDDTEYDYMQHLRELGTGSGEVVFVESTANQNKGKGKAKQSLEDALREMELKDKSEDLLDEDILPSKNLQRATYQAQQDVPDAIAGLQPDMDPRLREVLEALEDEAYVDDDDDVFQELAKDGTEIDEYEFDASHPDFEDDGWESDDTAKPAKEYRDSNEVPDLVDTSATAQPSQGPSEDWLEDFKKFKKDQKTVSRAAAPSHSELQSSIWTTTTNGGRRKKRKGALTNQSGYSMTSSSLVRTEQLGILDARFDKIEEEYNADMDDVGSVSAVSSVSSVQGPLRADFDNILDDFLGNYSASGKKHIKKGKYQTGLEQLAEIRKGLGPARIPSRYKSMFALGWSCHRHRAAQWSAPTIATMAFSGGSNGVTSSVRSQSPFSKLSPSLNPILLHTLSQSPCTLSFNLLDSLSLFLSSSSKLVLFPQTTSKSCINPQVVKLNFEMAPLLLLNVVTRDGQVFQPINKSAFADDGWDKQPDTRDEQQPQGPAQKRKLTGTASSSSLPSSPLASSTSSSLAASTTSVASSFSSSATSTSSGTTSSSSSSFSFSSPSSASSTSSPPAAPLFHFIHWREPVDQTGWSGAELNFVDELLLANDQDWDITQISARMVADEPEVERIQIAMDQLTIHTPDAEMSDNPAPATAPAPNPFASAAQSAPSNPFGGFGQPTGVVPQSAATPANPFAALTQNPVNPFAASSQPPSAANPFASVAPSTASNQPATMDTIGQQSILPSAQIKPFTGFGTPSSLQSSPAPQMTTSNPFTAASLFPTQSTPSTPSQLPLPSAPLSNGGLSSNPFTQPTSKATLSAAMNGSAMQAKPSFGQPTQPAGPSPATQSKSMTSGFAVPTPQAADSGTSASHTVDGARKRKNIFAQRDDTATKKSTGTPFSTIAPPNPALPAAVDSELSDYAKKIYEHLRKDGIIPMTCPNHLGNPSKRNDAEKFREAFKQHREAVRASLIRAKLIDDPDVKKTLKEAIVFKGICEEMCPEFEKITRIVQHDVKMPEKEAAADGTLCASMPLMVKALARSAAGQEAPLPMDVRSTAALRRTLDYLIDRMIDDDEKLPAMHNFLWDRTRAIRRDFVFHSMMSPKDMKNMVYCLENISRFHITALHLLSQKDFAADDFSEAQEKEQFTKSLLSLMEAYDDCRVKGIKCENEAEFRAYFVLQHLSDPNIEQKSMEWNQDLWVSSNDLHLATSMSQALKTARDRTGPLRPGEPQASALDAYVTFFRIVEGPDVSYTMACLAETHFLKVRRNILNNLIRAYSRSRDAPKDVTVAAVHELLRFDTTEETIEFVNQHGLSWSSDGHDNSYLLLERQSEIAEPTVRQSFSHNLVEKKRGNHSLPEIIHTTVFEESVASEKEEAAAVKEVSEPISQDEESLFIPQDGKQHTSNKPHVSANPFSKSSHTQPSTSTKPSLDAPLAGKNTTQPPKIQISPPITTAGPASAPSISTTKATDSIPRAQQPGPPANDSQMGIFAPREPGSIGGPKPTSILSASSSLANKGISSAAPTAGSENVSGGRKSLQAQSSPTLASDASKPPPTVNKASSDIEASQPKVPAASPTTTADSTKQLSGLSAARTGEDRPPQEPAAQSANSEQHEPQNDPPKQALAKPTKISAPTKKSDAMGSFTEWFVNGDDGLLQDFQGALVQHILKDAYESFIEQEEKNRREKEEAESLAKAMQWRHHNLGLKFFYRWRENARERRLQRRAVEVRETTKAWRESKAAERRAAREQEAAKLRLSGNSFTEDLRASVDSRASLRRSRLSSAETMLATGVLKGVRDEQAAAARAVRTETPTSEVESIPSTPVLKRQSVNTREDYKPITLAKTKLTLRMAANRAAAKRALSMSPPASEPSRNRSYSPTGSASNFRHSFSARTTNFSRTYKNTPPARETTERRSNIRSNHWRLRAMGLVHTPDGGYVPEALVNSNSMPLLTHSRSLSLQNGDVAENLQGRASLSDRLRRSISSSKQPPPTSSSSPQGSKRKRSMDAEDESDDAGRGEGSPTGLKKQKKAWDPAEAERILGDLRETIKALDEGAQWYHEQNERMKESSTSIYDG
ncbi:uncharacterized protein E0L32_009154 [Thyridium curvatum]|uniref:SAC3/GANP/THP3 conserved domain-containing protein n=1 Tax=Thyridium curvatum TaxID=1093900 RepID=A0A507AXN3_9PEZI|nr:uncharacterized protein E0L32_009154 [Thyridium curvatum]TPX09681.1 hypothetical protein E0L32_009154 [Thyridium curvatum]